MTAPQAEQQINDIEKFSTDRNSKAAAPHFEHLGLFNSDIYTSYKIIVEKWKTCQSQKKHGMKF
jgi:hypothetical protein